MPPNIADKAKRLMNERKVHCAQAVFVTFVEQLGLGDLDVESSMKIASAFSGGIAHTGNVCGALNGALMALGLKYGGADSTKVNEVATKFLDEFKSLHGTTICRELIDHDLITEEDVQRAFKTGAFDKCPQFVEDASIILERILKDSS